MNKFLILHEYLFLRFHDFVQNRQNENCKPLTFVAISYSYNCQILKTTTDATPDFIQTLISALNREFTLPYMYISNNILSISFINQITVSDD